MAKDRIRHVSKGDRPKAKDYNLLIDLAKKLNTGAGAYVDATGVHLRPLISSISKQSLRAARIFPDDAQGIDDSQETAKFSPVRVLPVTFILNFDSNGVPIDGTFQTGSQFLPEEYWWFFGHGIISSSGLPFVMGADIQSDQFTGADKMTVIIYADCN